MILLLATAAYAGDTEQAVWDAAYGGALTMGWSIGVGEMSSHTDLFGQIDPSLGARFKPSPMFDFGYYGLGAGMYDISGFLTFGGPERHDGALSTQTPGACWVHMTYGINPLGMLVDEHVGLGPELAMHAGAAGETWIGVDKVGRFSYDEITHVHSGLGVQGYVMASRRVFVMADVAWMPSRFTGLTIGKIDGQGAFDPGDPRITLPSDWDQGVVMGLVELENHLIARQDLAGSARIGLGPLALTYQVRDVTYGIKSGAGVSAEKFSVVTQIFGVQLQAPLEHE